MPFTPEDWVAGEAWAEPVDLTPLIERLRAGGIDVNVARIESDARAGDPPDDAVWTTPCPECFEEQAVKESGVGYGGRKWSRLTCGHLTFRSPPGATS